MPAILLDMSTLIAAAAAKNNAGWCDAICRSHGLHTELDMDAWTSRERTPPLYPDAVTLVAELSAFGLLARIDGSAGSSIKDSFASLDLRVHGYRVLFDAQWIVCRDRTVVLPGRAPLWSRVRTTAELAAWEDAWRREADFHGLFRAQLLKEPDVSVLAAHSHDCIVAGAVLFCAAGVVGISNFFSEREHRASCWEGCVAAAGEIFPDLPLVGYESGDALTLAVAHGFDTAGPLRVWVREP